MVGVSSVFIPRLEVARHVSRETYGVFRQLVIWPCFGGSLSGKPEDSTMPRESCLVYDAPVQSFEDASVRAAQQFRVTSSPPSEMKSHWGCLPRRAGLGAGDQHPENLNNRRKDDQPAQFPS